MHAMGPRSPGGGMRHLFAVAGVAVALGASVALVAIWPSGGSGTVSVSRTVSIPAVPGGRTAPGTAGATAPATRVPKGAVRIRSCGPIFGGGAAHPVASTARREIGRAHV